MTDTTAPGQIRKPNIRDAALLMVLGCLWGSAFLPIKVAVVETGPVLLVFLRVVCALVPLWLYMTWRGGRFPDNRFDRRLIFAMSLLNSVVPFLLLSWAGLHINSGVMALIMGISPLLSLFISHLSTHDDKFSSSKFIGMLIGFSGLMVIVGGDALGGFSKNLAGDLAVVGAISCYAVATAMVRKVRTTSKEAIATSNMIVSIFVLAPLLLLTDPPPIADLSLSAILAIAYLGVVTTGFGYLMRYHMVLTVGQSYMSMASYIMPIVGVVLGVIFLSEPLSANVMIALGLVLGGFAFARFGG